MTDFLLELRCEEIPARMQDRARDDLAKLFAAELVKAGLSAEDVTTYATPRRLALIARGLPLETAAVSEEHKGPRTSAPAQALEGFLRKTGLTQDQLEDRDGVWFAVVDKPGRATVEVLAEAIPAIIRAFPWPKSMRWGSASASTESLRWVRPLQGIVATFGDHLVPCEVDGIGSCNFTFGHRFHSAGEIRIGGADFYCDALRAAHVIVDQDERRAIIRDGAQALCAARGLSWIADEALVAENAGLTEWPVPLLGDFDTAFLDVPPEVIRLTLATNQKYFVCKQPSPERGGGPAKLVEGHPRVDLPLDQQTHSPVPLHHPADGPPPRVGEDFTLAPAFICTANIEAKDGGAAIIAGNRKVLAARLSDARFFWEQDKKTPLAVHAEKLSRITFHEKLGSVADKVERVAKLAEWLATEQIVPGCDPLLARQAARLCKADLVTEMVGEFPELQGIMGGYYARAEGLPDAVADAIRDHYKPVGQGDDVPTAPVTVAVSLADKLDTLVGFFGRGLPPSGSKDPFALRRASLGLLALWIGNDVRLTLRQLIAGAVAPYEGTVAPNLSKALGITIAPFNDDLYDQLSNFLIDRLKVQQREAGVRHDLIDAVFALGGEDDLVRLLARVKALQAFVGTADGVNLLAGYKRAANIVKKEGGASGDQTTNRAQAELVEAPGEAGAGTLRQAQGERYLGYTPEVAEAALIAALDAAEPASAAAVSEERFGDAMAALASLRAPIDAFFDSVTVNDADPVKRAARLALLARLTAAVNGIADFSKIEG